MQQRLKRKLLFFIERARQARQDATQLDADLVMFYVFYADKQTSNTLGICSNLRGKFNTHLAGIRMLCGKMLEIKSPYSEFISAREDLSLVIQFEMKALDWLSRYVRDIYFENLWNGKNGPPQLCKPKLTDAK